jgi:class 3 adenylate cyclase
LVALDLAHDQLQLTYDAAARFVPTDLLRILGHQSIRDVRLGDQVAHPMSTLFADIRGFSALAEAIGPARTFEVINRYLSFMEPAIHANRGLILQFLGDGIMALFPGTADDSVRGAIAMHQALARFNAERIAAGEAPLRVGIGINTGTVMVGTIGGRERLDSSVIGDSVNLASRIEGMTKMYGVALLIGEQTHRALQRPSDFALREVDRVVAKGTTIGQSIYEVLDILAEEPRKPRVASLAAYASALDAFKRGAFAQARQGFQEVTKSDTADPAAAAMLARSAEMEAHPPASWMGATKLETK